MNSNPRGERQVTHFADEHTLARLAELERENDELRALYRENIRCECADNEACRFVRERDELRRDRERLERENAKLTDDYEEVLQIRGTMEWQYEQDKAELAELRRDKERLDVLEKLRSPQGFWNRIWYESGLNSKFPKGWYAQGRHQDMPVMCNSVREALDTIDAAMQEDAE